MLIKNRLAKSTMIFLIALISVVNSKFVYAESNKAIINKEIQAIIDADREKYKIVGIQVSISLPNETTPRDFVSGTTTLNGSVPINPNTLFQVGSITKSFIATILLQMQSEQLLSLNDPIGKWLPQIPDNWKNITIKQLLNHTSGLFNYMETIKFKKMVSNDFTKQWSPEELISLIIDEPFYFSPGHGFHYSNTNYILAGMIIQAASEKSVNESIENRLLKSLQLTNTYYLPCAYDQNIMQRIAHGYSQNGLFPDEPKDITYFNMSIAGTAGAMVSTAHDIAIWLRNLLTGSVLSPTQLSELMNLVDENSGQPIPTSSENQGYGLGIEHYIDPATGSAWFHTGETAGYSAWMIWLQCDDIVITTVVNDVKENMQDNNALLIDLITYIQKYNSSSQCHSKQQPNIKYINNRSSLTNIFN